jgi:hypothetical protein
MVLFANILLIIWDWNSLRVLLNLSPVVDREPRLEDDSIWLVTGLILFLFTFVYRIMIDQYDVLFWLVICGSVGLAGLVIGLWKAQHKTF